MLINLKNKEYLILDEFKFKCCIGKNGLKSKKKEGDKCTPKTKLKLKKITKNMGWCDDPYNKNYNKEIILNKKCKGEKLFRKDKIYDILVVIKYNMGKIKPFEGSAIFIHLTKNYNSTKGCIALKKNDMLILLKLLKPCAKIKIF